MSEAKVMMFIGDEQFTNKQKWITVDFEKMEVVPPAIVGEGTYRTRGGIYYKIDECGRVVDDTDAWNRGESL